MARACRSAWKRLTTWAESIPGLMILSATRAPNRLVLLGQINRPHAPGADPLEEQVGTNAGARPFGAGTGRQAVARGLGVHGCGGPGLDGRLLEEAARKSMGLQQRVDFAAQLEVVAARAVQIDPTRVQVPHLCGFVEDRLNALRLGTHRMSFRMRVIRAQDSTKSGGGSWHGHHHFS